MQTFLYHAAISKILLTEFLCPGCFIRLEDPVISLPEDSLHLYHTAVCRTNVCFINWGIFLIIYIYKIVRLCNCIIIYKPGKYFKYQGKSCGRNILLPLMCIKIAAWLQKDKQQIAAIFIKRTSFSCHRSDLSRCNLTQENKKSWHLNSFRSQMNVFCNPEAITSQISAGLPGRHLFAL